MSWLRFLEQQGMQVMILVTVDFYKFQIPFFAIFKFTCVEALGSEGLTLLRNLSEEVQSKFTSLSEEVQSKFTSLSLDVHSLKSTITFVSQSISPSDGCKTEAEPGFLRMMDTLKLPRQMDIYSLVTDGIADNACLFPKFSWQWNGRDEVNSYIHVMEYLSACQLNSFDVHKGKHLPSGCLFNSPVYTLKTNGVRPVLVLYVKGTSDILVASTQATDIRSLTRSQYEFCIEVKTVDAMEKNVNECLREAVIQLVGLNASNAYRSPSVLLTNLTRRSFVLYLDADDERNVALRVLKFSEFHQALFFCNSLCGREPLTANWGKPPTPEGSRRDGDSPPKAEDEESDAYEKVTLDTAVRNLSLNYEDEDSV
jgi:hypothetical protein